MTPSDVKESDKSVALVEKVPVTMEHDKTVALPSSIALRNKRRESYNSPQNMTGSLSPIYQGISITFQAQVHHMMYDQKKPTEADNTEKMLQNLMAAEQNLDKREELEESFIDLSDKGAKRAVDIVMNPNKKKRSWLSLKNPDFKQRIERNIAKINKSVSRTTDKFFKKEPASADVYDYYDSGTEAPKKKGGKKPRQGKKDKIKKENVDFEKEEHPERKLPSRKSKECRKIIIDISSDEEVPTADNELIESQKSTVVQDDRMILGRSRSNSPENCQKTPNKFVPKPESKEKAKTTAIIEKFKIYLAERESKDKRKKTCYTPKKEKPDENTFIVQNLENTTPKKMGRSKKDKTPEISQNSQVPLTANSQNILDETPKKAGRGRCPNKNTSPDIFAESPTVVTNYNSNEDVLTPVQLNHVRP